MAKEVILELKNVKKSFLIGKGRDITVLDNINLNIFSDDFVSILGQSGAGKSTLLRIMAGIIEPTEGEVLYKGIPLRKANARIAVVFQSFALFPWFNVLENVRVGLVGQGLNDEEINEKAIRAIDLVGLDGFEDAYPRELSGGMRQRIMIAMAISCNPSLLIADEPTTALDVTIQAQVLELMKEMQRRFNTAFILISHDLGVVAEMADRVAVMYAGRIVEEAETAALLKRPLHPYTGGLIASRPALAGERKPLQPIPGQGPDLLNRPPGCLYHPRCHRRREICRQESPPELQPEPGRRVSCWLYAEEQEDGGGDR